MRDVDELDADISTIKIYFVELPYSRFYWSTIGTCEEWLLPPLNTAGIIIFELTKQLVFIVPYWKMINFL